MLKYCRTSILHHFQNRLVQFKLYLGVWLLSLFLKETPIVKHVILNVFKSQQVTISYGSFRRNKQGFLRWLISQPVLYKGLRTENRVSIPDGIFSETEDPTRLASSVVIVTQASAIVLYTTCTCI